MSSRDPTLKGAIEKGQVQGSGKGTGQVGNPGLSTLVSEQALPLICHPKFTHRKVCAYNLGPWTPVLVQELECQRRDGLRIKEQGRTLMEKDKKAFRL